MQKTLKILPLRLIAHSDRTSILVAYSRELGRVSFAVASGSGPGASRRRALLMPLNPVEVVASSRGLGELLTFREPRALMPIHVVMSSPERSAVALFMAEVIERVLRHSEPDALMFDFLYEAVVRLNREDTSPANFHLCFMVRLAGMLGLAPDWRDYSPGMVFDLRDGVFRLSAPLHGQSLGAAQSRVAASIMRMTWDNQSAYRFDRHGRNDVLDLLIEYYSLHLTDLTTLRSPAVLRALF